MIPVDDSRRKFLGTTAAAAGALALAPGVMLYTYAEVKVAGAAGERAIRWGMLVDTTKCASGCTACIDACNTEHGIPAPKRPTDVQWIRKVELKDKRTGAVHSMPVMCQHCAEPPCVDVCPTGASFKRADGIVMVDRHTCIGCRYCMMACPYKARSFVHEPTTNKTSVAPRGKGCVESCTMCVHRVDKGGTPACVEACADAGHRAIIFGDLNDPSSEIAKRARAAATTQLRADLRTDNGVRYQGL